MASLISLFRLFRKESTKHASQVTDPMTNQITLFCLVKGESIDAAFPVEIDQEGTVGSLKKLIRSEMAPDLDSLAAKNLTLWAVSIPTNDDAAVPDFNNLDKRRLRPTWKISKAFPEAVEEDYIHILVEAPAPSPRTESQEVQELREQIMALREEFLKSEYAFELIVKPKQTA